MTRLHAALFWAAAALLAVAHVIVAWNSLTQNRLWEDEAFNLTVPRNLLAGLGYTSDGTLSGSVLEPWDVRISTGPTVLLPVAAVMALGADPVIGGRSIVLLFWIALLAGLFLLGNRIGGRWAGLAAVATALAIDTVHTPSPIQGPTDILGEIPAAALIVWGFVVLRRRPWLAGLLVGLAVLTKLIAALALPAFAVWLLLRETGSFGARFSAAWRRAWPALIGVVAPSALYYLVVLVDLGFGGFLDFAREFRDFLTRGGPQGVHTTVGEKLSTLLGAWWVPGGVAVAAAVLVVALAVLACVRSGRLDAPRSLDERDGNGATLAYVAAAATGVVAYVGWWATAAHLPLWIRHPTPGLFAFAPLLVAGAVVGARILIARNGKPWRGLGLAAAAALAVVVVVPPALHTGFAAPPSGALAAQRAVAEGFVEAIAENDVELPGGYLASNPWGSGVSLVFLTGAHVGLFDAPAMAGAPQLSYFECENSPHVDPPVRLCLP
ncbi:hypothetical protein [Microbacterium stercoris]|uniref:Glycosyltransferase RgtA/B/C/D-like domain-containing protein n=1 Tax=Microbacterium stercoris TaxID=2820289 RepID=A0A939QIG4_9MICO|nr:hypothetical protein [Microbacterium stercoris]MBO3663517.1 hypothetical protein [Microbacterium stercoris]